MASADRASIRVLVEPLHEVSGDQVMVGLRSALAWLQANQEQVNDLNVFPVPDGDTGSNMYLTLRSAVEEAQAAGTPTSAASVLGAAAHGSLMGARGNSGVILSQIFRGFAQGVGDKARLDAAGVAAGLGEAARVAYKAVMKPTEGTILTVVREAAEAARAAAAESSDIRAVLDRAVREGHAAVERTTEQLQVLREAGVVDAGGFGFAVILEGFGRALSETDANLPSVTPRRRSGEPRVNLPYPDADTDAEAAAEADTEAGAAPEGDGHPDGDDGSGPPTAGPARKAGRRGAAAVAERDEGWGYCTEFLINGPGLDPDRLREELGALGDSAMVVGGPDLVRVHIHTADPAALISAASQRGRLAKLKVEDMTAQHHEVLERADAAEATAASVKRVGVVAVAPGDGFRQIFESLGADCVVEGGQTMNPSIEDLLTAVRQVPAASVVILPNNGNVILTAEQVDDLAEGVDVAVARSRSLPQGISALLALDPEADAAGNARRMSEAMSRISAIEVTRAVRDSAANGLEIKSGDVIALIDDEITQKGEDYGDVITAVLRNHEKAPELVTVYWGAEVDEAQATQLVDRLRSELPDTEFEVHRGGQEHYPYVLSLE